MRLLAQLDGGSLLSPHACLQVRDYGCSLSRVVMKEVHSLGYSTQLMCTQNHALN